MISIVLTHFNRSHLLNKTLHSLSYNKTKEFEVVIVDDGSVPQEKKELRDLVHQYTTKGIKFQLYFLSATEKWYDNPCIPYNIGIRKAKGDKIIIQSAECVHVGKLLDYVEKNLKENEYFSFGCYSFDRNQTEQLQKQPVSTPQDVLKIANPPNNNAVTHCEQAGWYNHSRYRPLGYHWCNAYNTSDIKKIKMFDERYSKGIAYDDDEFAYRCNRDLDRVLVDSPMVIHQWHGLGNYYKQPNPVENQLKQDYNSALLQKITRQEHNNDNIENELSKCVNVYE